MKFLFTLLFMLVSISIAKADDFTINLDPGFSTNITAMSDYVDRGISQSFGQKFSIKLGKSSITHMFPALNVTETYTLENGLFGSVTAVNSTQGNNGWEGDLMVGYKTKLSDSWSYQTDVQYTAYPGASNYGNISVVEFQNIVNYTKDWGKLVGAFAFQPMGQNHSGFYTYTAVGIDYNLPWDMVFGVRVGYNTYSNHKAKPNYVDLTVILTKNITKNLSVALQYTNSNDYIELGNGQRIVGLVNISF